MKGTVSDEIFQFENTVLTFSNFWSAVLLEEALCIPITPTQLSRQDEERTVASHRPLGICLLHQLDNFRKATANLQQLGQNRNCFHCHAFRRKLLNLPNMEIMHLDFFCSFT